LYRHFTNFRTDWDTGQPFVPEPFVPEPFVPEPFVLEPFVPEPFVLWCRAWVPKAAAALDPKYGGLRSHHTSAFVIGLTTNKQM
jgi:hypothetical protein